MTKPEDANRAFALLYAKMALPPAAPQLSATSTDAKLLIATPRALPGPDGVKIFDVLLD